MDIQYHQPKDRHMFTDSSNRWRVFRNVRFRHAADGQHVVLKGLDLSGLQLHKFAVDHVAFVQCKLDGTSFKETNFSFATAFIGCSLRNADFSDTHGSNVLMQMSDLTGARFPAHPLTWASIDMQKKLVPSYFVNCILDKDTEEYLIDDGNLIINDTAITNDSKVLKEVNTLLYEIVTAPVMDI